MKKKIIGLFVMTLLIATFVLPIIGNANDDNSFIEYWSEQDKLIASDGSADEYFGCSVSIDGDYALIGAYWDDDNGQDSGSAYVFKRNGTTWIEEAKLKASDGYSGDYFGHSVSIDGDYALIGVYHDDDNGSNTGSAYVFKRNGTTWTEEAKLNAADADAGDWFGYRVSIDGDYALIGAILYDVYNNGENSGSVYVFKRSGTTWTEYAKLTASDGAAGDFFGISVYIEGSTALIGAYGDDDNGENSGSVYVFKLNGTTWIEESKLTASDGLAGDKFGNSVYIDGDYALIGAHCSDDNGDGSGSAYIFKNEGEKQPPVADFTYSPINPTTSDIVQFTSTSTDDDGYIAFWSWDFGDGNVSSIPNPTHQYSINGTYEVTLEVTDNDGLTDDISKIVHVGDIEEFTTNLSNGWNLVSPPFNQSVPKLDLIVKYNGYYYDWSQATSTSNPTGSPIINQYIFGWNRVGQSYYFASALDTGYGHWVYSYQNDCELWAINITITPDDYITGLKTGWNLIGLPDDTPVSKTDLIIKYGGIEYNWSTAVSNGYMSQYVFGWDRILQSYNFANTIDPVQGYWMYAYEDCELWVET